MKEESQSRQNLDRTWGKEVRIGRQQGTNKREGAYHSLARREGGQALARGLLLALMM
jgi:hypothetical protein